MWEVVRNIREPRFFQGATLKGKLVKTGFLGYFYRESLHDSPDIVLQSMADAGWGQYQRWQQYYRNTNQPDMWSRINRFLLDGEIKPDEYYDQVLIEFNRRFGAWLGRLRAQALMENQDSYSNFREETQRMVREGLLFNTVDISTRSIDRILTLNQQVGLTIMMNAGLVGHPDLRERINHFK